MRLNLRKAQNIRFDQDLHRILFELDGKEYRACYSSLLREFFIEDCHGTRLNNLSTYLHFPGLVVKYVDDHHEITVAPKLHPIDESPYTYVRDSQTGNCTIKFKGKIQRFGATFYGEESDILSFVIKGITALNRAHQLGESSVLIERPNRQPVVVYIDRAIGKI